jgi:hypothetical protein
MRAASALQLCHRPELIRRGISNLVPFHSSHLRWTSVIFLTRLRHSIPFGTPWAPYGRKRGEQPCEIGV